MRPIMTKRTLIVLLGIPLFISGCVPYETVPDVHARLATDNRTKAEHLADDYQVHDYTFFGITMFAPVNTAGMELQHEYPGVGSIWNFNTGANVDFPGRSVELNAANAPIQIVAIQRCDSLTTARTLASATHDALRSRFPMMMASDEESMGYIVSFFDPNAVCKCLRSKP